MWNYMPLVATAFLALLQLAKDWGAHQTTLRRALVLLFIVAFGVGGTVNTYYANKRVAAQHLADQKQISALQKAVETANANQQANTKQFVQSFKQLSQELGDLQTQVKTADLQQEVAKLRNEVEAAQRAAMSAGDPFTPEDLTKFTVEFTIPADQALVKAYLNRLTPFFKSSPPSVEIDKRSEWYPRLVSSERALADLAYMPSIHLTFKNGQGSVQGDVQCLADSERMILQIAPPHVLTLSVLCVGNQVSLHNNRSAFRSFRDFEGATVALLPTPPDYASLDDVPIGFVRYQLLSATLEAKNGRLISIHPSPDGCREQGFLTGDNFRQYFCVGKVRVN